MTGIKRTRIDVTQVERTDPDWNDKADSKMIRDFLSLDLKWKCEMLRQLDKRQCALILAAQPEEFRKCVLIGKAFDL
jgi:hypothetical protein